MTAAELYHAGQLAKAIDAQIQEVKSKPADHGRRLFLFELLCFAGELDRAQRQIDAIKYDALELQAAVENYRGLLESERKRRNLFTQGLSPKFLRDPPEHVRLRLEAVNRLREARPAEALDFLTRATDAEAPVPGQLNGQQFAELRDCDDLFGTVLEVMAHKDYFWVPLEQIDSIAMNAPATPRDLIWVSARLEMRDGPSGEVFLPAIYPGTHEQSDEALKLGRATDWKQADGGPTLGVGRRDFLVDEEVRNLLEWEQLTLDPSPEPEPTAQTPP